MCVGFSVFAWTGPTGAPPNNNVSAPVNVGTVDQVKNSGLSVNTLAVFGRTGITGNTGIGVATPTQRLDVQGGVIRQNMNSTFDVWIQGGASTAGGDARNLAFLGTDEDSGDTLYLNYNNEYSSGTIIGSILTVSGNVTAPGYFHSSDARLKKNVETSPGLSIISKLRGVVFDWKKDGTPSAGLIAQEVEGVMPSAVHTDEEGMKSVEYDQLIAPMIEAIKEQQAEIELLKAEIAALKQK